MHCMKVPRASVGKKVQQVVFETLAIIQKLSEPGLHLLVTSCDETNICDVLYSDLCPSLNEIVSMKNAFTNHNIESFMSGHLKDSYELCKWADHRSQIESALAKRAEGVCVFHLLLGPVYCPHWHTT